MNKEREKNCGEKNPFYGKLHTEEAKERMVENYLKWRKENPEEAYQKSLQGAMKSLQSQNRKKTSIEIKVETYLKDNMIDYQYQYATTNYFIYDFFLEKYNCLIEVQGDYWHSSEKKKDIDERKKLDLQNKGYFILYIKENEIEKDINKVKTNIIKFWVSHISNNM